MMGWLLSLCALEGCGDHGSDSSRHSASSYASDGTASPSPTRSSCRTRVFAISM